MDIQYRQVYRSLRHAIKNRCEQHEKADDVLWIMFICGLGLALVLLCSGCAYSYTLDEYADAIKHAEGNSNYGILTHYKHTSYRQACKNTVWHRWLLYRKEGLKTPFIAFLGVSYCPIGASNDPRGLNINWQRNVYFFLNHPTKG